VSIEGVFKVHRLCEIHVKNPLFSDFELLRLTKLEDLETSRVRLVKICLNLFHPLHKRALFDTPFTCSVQVGFFQIWDLLQGWGTDKIRFKLLSRDELVLWENLMELIILFLIKRQLGIKEDLLVNSEEVFIEFHEEILNRLQIIICFFHI
jgi:hypothetical protein